MSSICEVEDVQTLCAYCAETELFEVSHIMDTSKMQGLGSAVVGFGFNLGQTQRKYNVTFVQCVETLSQ